MKTDINIKSSEEKEIADYFNSIKNSTDSDNNYLKEILSIVENFSKLHVSKFKILEEWMLTPYLFFQIRNNIDEYVDGLCYVSKLFKIPINVKVEKIESQLNLITHRLLKKDEQKYVDLIKDTLIENTQTMNDIMFKYIEENQKYIAHGKNLSGRSVSLTNLKEYKECFLYTSKQLSEYKGFKEKSIILNFARKYYSHEKEQERFYKRYKKFIKDNQIINIEDFDNLSLVDKSSTIH